MKKKTKLEMALCLIESRRHTQEKLLQQAIDEHDWDHVSNNDGRVLGLLMAEHILKEEIKWGRNKKANFGVKPT